MQTNHHPLAGMFGSPFGEKQLTQIQAQLPDATIDRWYQAAEGDWRVIAKHPGEPYDVRYTVAFSDDGYPRLSRMD